MIQRPKATKPAMVGKSKIRLYDRLFRNLAPDKHENRKMLGKKHCVARDN